MQRKQPHIDQSLAEKVDRFIEARFVERDPVLDATLESIREAGMPTIQVSPCYGKLLYMLAKISRAHRVLELGTLAGYSTIWLGRALPEDGRLVSLELDANYAAIARKNIAFAELSGRVEIRVGPALTTLRDIAEADEPPFDLVFIDADKSNYAVYLEAVVPLMRTGGLLLADNVIRRGDILDPQATDESATGARAFLDALAADSRLESLVLQQLGIKGHDGLAISIVR